MEPETETKDSLLSEIFHVLHRKAKEMVTFEREWEVEKKLLEVS